METHTINNFIGVFKNAYSKEFCEEVIKQYEDMVESGYGHVRSNYENISKMSKDDEFVFDEVDYMPLRSSKKEFNGLFWNKYFPIYEQEYAILKDSGHHSTYELKIQKVKIGGGYHVWHYESGNREHCNRLLAWMVYLNDVHEGGETEFIYQHKRVKPEQGTLVIWPAGFTHAHRGNPPLSNEKYIITGWTEF